jgi:hypothetical protein
MRIPQQIAQHALRRAHLPRSPTSHNCRRPNRLPPRIRRHRVVAARPKNSHWLSSRRESRAFSFSSGDCGREAGAEWDLLFTQRLRKEQVALPRSRDRQASFFFFCDVPSRATVGNRRSLSLELHREDHMRSGGLSVRQRRLEYPQRHSAFRRMLQQTRTRERSR